LESWPVTRGYHFVVPSRGYPEELSGLLDYGDAGAAVARAWWPHVPCLGAREEEVEYPLHVAVFLGVVVQAVDPKGSCGVDEDCSGFC